MNVGTGWRSATGCDSNKVIWFNVEVCSSPMRAPKENQMKLLPVVAVVAAFAFAPVAFAQQAATPTNKADCEKAKLTWDAKGGKDAKGACVAAPAAKPADPVKK